MIFSKIVDILDFLHWVCVETVDLRLISKSRDVICGGHVTLSVAIKKEE